MPKIGEVVSSLRRCSKCKEFKGPEGFYQKGTYSQCKQCHKQGSVVTTRKWIARKREGNDIGFLVKRKLARLDCITLAEEIIPLYTTTCQVCSKDVGHSICLDHCHKTGKFRGFLCNGCNLALGSVGDDPERLRKLAAYLEANRV